MAKQMTMGVIVGNRGFFPSHLATSGRLEMIAALEAAGIRPIVLTPEETAHGAVESYEDAKKCAALFKAHAAEIDGIIITLPNFGEERGLADTLRLANLQVPVLIQATPDHAGKMTIAFRRDSFCGKMSICNNLKQYGIPYSLTTLHTEAPDSPEFKADLAWFAAVCRTVRGLKNVRFGAIGARPTAFNTVRYSEKLLERSGITVETLDLSEVMGRISRMADNDDAGQPADGGVGGLVRRRHEQAGRDELDVGDAGRPLVERQRRMRRRGGSERHRLDRVLLPHQLPLVRCGLHQVHARIAAHRAGRSGRVGEHQADRPLLARLPLRRAEGHAQAAGVAPLERGHRSRGGGRRRGRRGAGG